MRWTFLELTEARYEWIASLLPMQRGLVNLSSRTVLNTLLPIAGQWLQVRALPERLEPLHAVYAQLNRWAKRDVLERVSAELLHEQAQVTELVVLPIDSASIQLHLDGTGTEKGGPKRSDARMAARRRICTRIAFLQQAHRRLSCLRLRINLCLDVSE